MTQPDKHGTINSALPELIIIKYLLNTNNYNKYIKYINKELIKQKYPEVHKLYLVLDLLHSKLPQAEVKSIDDFFLFFNASYPVLKPGEREAYNLLFTSLKESNVSEKSCEEVVKVLSERALAATISEVAWRMSEGHADSSELEDLLNERSKVGGRVLPAQTLTFVDSSLEELLNQTMLKRGLRWPLRCLNRSLGSLRVGDFGFVFARPETGKTTFLAHVSTHMAMQAKQEGLGPILWLNNEENSRKVKTRFYQAAYGINKAQMLSDMRGIQERYERDIGNFLRIPQDSIKDRRLIESILEESRPSFVIIDQIDKVSGFDADRQDLVFGKIYQWARELAKQYCPIAGVCQASGDGEGVKWLTMNHVAEAKTSKQAEADWILGIGKTNDEETERVRYLNISKNKLSGDDDTVEEWRHGRFEVLIHPEIARYEDIELDG